MVDSNSAFLWETEALRSAPSRRPAERGRHERVDAGEADWLTLREASAATGIPVSTLRKWARRDAIPTYLDQTPLGEFRMVSLSGVYRRAEELGRAIETHEPGAPRPAMSEPPRPGTAVRSREPKLHAPEVRAGAPAPSPQAEPDVPEGTMLVPLDAWNKMLMQLGNLHQAGQQLAEARERAAKAETEATFLRERLAELKADLADARSPQADKTTFEVEEPMEPLTHIPIESSVEDAPERENDEESGEEIQVRDLGKRETPEATAVSPSDDEELLSLATYSVEVVKHLYNTWRGRPRR